MQYLNETGQQHRILIRALAAAGISTSLEEQLLAEDLPNLVQDVRKLGDPLRGELIYRRPEMTCMSCHAIAGGGPHLGPDLEGVGSSSPVDFIIEAVLEPGKKIKDQYGSVRVLTRDDRLYSGILEYQDEKEIIIRDADRRGEPTTIPASTVEELDTTLSLMPSGLVSALIAAGACVTSILLQSSHVRAISKMTANGDPPTAW